MSAAKLIHIYCDSCGNPFGVDNSATPGITVAQQRKDAKNNGWVFRGGKDFCEECKDKTKKHKP